MYSQTLNNHLLPISAALYLLISCLVLEYALVPTMTLIGLLISLLFGWGYKQCAASISTIALIAIVGLSSAGVQKYTLNQKSLSNNYFEGPVTLMGQVAHATQSPTGTSFVLSSARLCQATKCVKHNAKYQLYAPKRRLFPGEQWVLHAQLKPLASYRNPGLKDPADAKRQQGIVARGKMLSGDLVIPASTFYQLINRFKENLQIGLKNLKQAALLQGLIVGDKSSISDEQKQIFENTGTSHLLAISGLHIGSIAAIVGLMLTYCMPAMGGYRKSFASAVSMAVAIFYAFLAGFALPTQRAIIMIACLLVPNILALKIRLSDRIALAMLAVLLFDAFAIYNPGFWLSFGAVSIFAWVGQNRTSKKWQQWVMIQAAAFIGMFPLTSIFFAEVAWISPLANILAIPVVSAILPLALMGAFISQFSTVLGHTILGVGSACLNVLYTYLQLIAFSTIKLTPISVPGALLIFFGALWLLAPRGFWGKKWALICFLPILVSPQRPPQNEAWITVLDIGQGLSVVVQTAQHVLVYDTGPKLYGFDAGKQVLIPYLKTMGISQLDKLILSHLDSDHIGGANSLISRIQTLSIDSSDIRFPNSQSCLAGQKWVWDGVTFEYLFPTEDDWDLSKNNRSCVMKISSKAQQIILTGDIETEAEKRLVNRYGTQLRSTYITSPHHGSKSSSSQGFIGAIEPESILISAGRMNQYHHPHPSVINRYKIAQITWKNTADHGAITVRLR
ncbi:MAG: DNA internalization-related competence protein ComEC/Rec2 [Legionellales bacterium]|nr:DNA internalization-related competence protein ComEC/Rec2 [Legionellales bacterium]|tara:strand:+ start:82 stop:2280 length:2199 start_codon:yes stop_codon:yes gene_type:complete